MKEVKSPRKPLIYYYGIVLLVVILFNVFISPLLSKNVVEEVDYGTFMRMTEEKKIGRVEVEDSQILFTERIMKNHLQNQCHGGSRPYRAAVCIRCKILQRY